MRKLLLFSTAIFFLLISCKKEKDSPEPEPSPVAPVVEAEGSIIGKVILYDAFGSKLDSSAGTSTVAIEEIGKTVSTDIKGNFTLTAIKAGTYTIVYSKTNFGTFKAQGIVYKVGDKGNYDAELAMLPAFTLNSVSVIDTTWFATPTAGLYYRAYSTETNIATAAVAIISNTSNLSIAKPESYLYDMPVSPLLKATDYSRFVSYSFLKDNYDISKGTVLYIKIYPVAARAAFYNDLKLKRPVYTAYGTSFAQTFTILTK
jgi:hypothetical protein